MCSFAVITSLKLAEKSHIELGYKCNITIPRVTSHLSLFIHPAVEAEKFVGCWNMRAAFC